MHAFQTAHLAFFVFALLGATAGLHAQSPAPRYEKSECEFPLHVIYPRDLPRECGFLLPTKWER